MRYRLLNENIPHEIITKVESPLLARILWNRGYCTLDDIEPLINPDSYIPCTPDTIPGLIDAANLISKFKGKIAVYGDYDVDGITATTILVRTLRQAGFDVTYHVPNRFTEGYGMNSGVVRRLAEEGYQLILTCDCGISNHEEIALAKDLGMTVIVTDHHNLPETLVPADIVINPKMLDEDHPCHHIPGVGVAYLLSNAIQEVMDFNLNFESLQLVALGVICDVVPLIKENRYWARAGLNVLNSSNALPGIRALIEVSKISHIDEETVGFQLGPRLNAPGRLASADICVELLLTEDSEQAHHLAYQIEALNEERKMLVNRILGDFKDIVPEGCIVEYNEFWHEGVIGIAAGRLCEAYHVPVVLLTRKEDGVITGSGRSIDDVNIYEALSKVQEHLVKYGGHAKAAGLSTTREKLDTLVKNLKQELSVDQIEEEIAIDMDADLNSVDITAYGEIAKLSPFGEGFARPVFRSFGAHIEEFQIIGEGKHTRLKLSTDSGYVSGIWWNSRLDKRIPNAAIVYRVGVNDFNGCRSVQLEVLSLDTNETQANRSLEIQDLRYLPGNNPPVITGTRIGRFVEGKNAGRGEFNRYGVRLCDTLVLASVPASLKILKDIIQESDCSKLILAYEIDSPRAPLLNRLMGVIKAGSMGKALLSVRRIAVMCEATESAVQKGLALLEASGYLKISYQNGGIQPTLLTEFGTSHADHCDLVLDPSSH
jgi:single-stranded-DNA-specific exonuclease